MGFQPVVVQAGPDGKPMLQTDSDNSARTCASTGSCPRLEDSLTANGLAGFSEINYHQKSVFGPQSPVAQLVEQAAVNRWVVGSSPTGGA